MRNINWRYYDVRLNKSGYIDEKRNVIFLEFYGF